ncbi:MAG: hypothetical protein PHS80_13200 [Methanothrix sp.]|nr:hypothetical protein [Methanothrix sp.]MDD4448620.1 hypothetical protein [Methanothrix sp.]
MAKAQLDTRPDCCSAIHAAERTAQVAPARPEPGGDPGRGAGEFAVGTTNEIENLSDITASQRRLA